MNTKEQGEEEQKSEESVEQDLNEEKSKIQEETCEKTDDDFMEAVRKVIEGREINIILGNYVNQNHGVVTGDNAQFEDIDFSEKGKNSVDKEKNAIHKKQDRMFRTQMDVCNWMKENFGKEKFLWLISLAVFHDMPYIWVNTNAQLLKSRKVFSDENECDSNEIYTKDELLDEIGAFTYTGYIITSGGKTEAEFVSSLDEDIVQNVLECVWNQFVDYRSGLMEWLKLFAYQANLSQSYAAIRAISTVAQLDYYYFETHMMNGLLTDDNIAVLAQVMHLIAENEKFRENINNVVRHWGTLTKCSYLLVALLVAQKNHWSESGIEPIMVKYIEGTQNEIRKTWLGDYQKNFPLMFAMGQNKSAYYKALIGVVYNKIYLTIGIDKNMQKENMEQLFLMMVETDFEYTKASKHNRREMILVNMLFVRNECAEMLLELWKALWRKHKVHMQVKNIMTEYWRQKIAIDFRYEKQMKAFWNKLDVGKSEQHEIYASALKGEAGWRE